MKVEFYRHHLGPQEVDAVVTTLGSVFLATGADNARFERLFAEYLGVEDTVTMSSCTAALHLALAGLCVGEGDEVITTAMSFIATANAILMVGATPVFVDVDRHTGLIDLDAVEAAISPRTKAVIPVHLYGQMVDMRRLREIANRHGLFIIEDAAHAVESRRDGAQPGQLSDAACFSFYATKNITSGEGGALATNRRELAELTRQLRNHGMSKSAAARYTGRYQHWDMEAFGWKYTLTNFQASLLIPQLGRIEELLERREEIARRYDAAFSQAGVECPRVLPGDNRSARHLFPIWADENDRDEVLLELENRGIGVAVHYRAIPTTTFYRTRFHYESGCFPVAERIGRRTISLPFYPALRDDEIEYVIEQVTTVCGKERVSGKPTEACTL